jgi:hypothetical protein
MVPRPSSSSAAATAKKKGGMKQGSLFSFFSKKAKADGPKSADSQPALPNAGAPPANQSAKNPPLQTSAPPAKASVAPPHNQALLSQVQIGVHIDVYWSEDDTWYCAKVTKHRAEHSYYLEYEDGQCEWIDLSTEPFRLAHKKKRRIQEEEESDAEAEFEMPEDSEDEESAYNDDANDDEEDDDQWMVTDDEADQEHTSGKKSKKPTKKQKTSSTNVAATTSGASRRDSATGCTLSKFAARKVTVTEHAAVAGKTPLGGTSRSTPKQITPRTGLTPSSNFSQPSPLAGTTTAAVTKTNMQQPKQAPPAFVTGSLNPAGSHVHNHLAFLQNPTDSSGRTPDHPDYDPRTLKLQDRDWFKVTGKKMTDAVKQWWDLKSQYFDSVLLFKTGMYP